MNFTYTPPTEPGDYWTKDKFGTMRTRHVWRNEFGVLVSHYCGKEWWRPVDRMGFQILWGPRVEPPQPVPWDVMDAVDWLRKIANQEGFLGAWSETTKAAVLKICDYIAPPKELPPVTLSGDLWQQLCDLAGIGFSDATGENYARFSQLIRDANKRITSGATP